mmetsp:Transcript_13707/g.31426  ORF Transcript_13707/g.31426 Transcript_13707/m.31426 type:complete len:225 (+) Transcript_13707:764-1438(+)
MTEAPASAQAIACAIENAKVMLQAMPSRSSFWHASIPVYVAGSMIITRCGETRRCAYRSISRFARSIITRGGAYAKPVSSSVLTTPAFFASNLVISHPTSTVSPSADSLMPDSSTSASSASMRLSNVADPPTRPDDACLTIRSIRLDTSFFVVAAMRIKLGLVIAPVRSFAWRSITSRCAVSACTELTIASAERFVGAVTVHGACGDFGSHTSVPAASTTDAPR